MKYGTVKTNFEINNFFIKNPVMYGTINFEGELKLRNETEFKTLHQRLKYIGINPITGEDEEKSFIMAWLYDETARQYEKLEFLPKQETPNIFFNSFSGFEVEKQHEGDIKLNFEESNLYILLNHLCGNDPKVLNYVLKWIANRVQKPYEITKVALLFKVVNPDTFNEDINVVFPFNVVNPDTFNMFKLVKFMLKLLIIIN
jgi:hypothetical protein